MANVNDPVDRRPVRVIPADEGEDERIERKAAEARQRVEQVLQTFELSDGEEQFARRVGEQIVDLTSTAYLDWVHESDKRCDVCIAAAVAIALAIVHDPR